MWEISSHTVPFADKSIGEVYTLLKGSAKFRDDKAPRPPIVAGTPKSYKTIMQKCWRQNPRSRPAMTHIMADLEKLERVNAGYETPIEFDTYEPEHPTVSLQSARELHSKKKYNEAFKQFQKLADEDDPNPEANFYVGRYHLDQRIDLPSAERDHDIGISYLEVAEDLGCDSAIQYHAQEKMAAATAIRKEFLDQGKQADADEITKKMKTECLGRFREGANRGNLRCMKDLADYGAKLGDRESYIDGRRMLTHVCESPNTTASDKAEAQKFLGKLQQHQDVIFKLSSG
jgi:hypothetical protein